MTFDNEQQKVINADKGYFLVLAPPGCGKTELLTHRILQAHEKGVSFQDMLCLTFTNRAARGMKERIDAIIGGSCDGLFVGNIHRFCSRFLFENHAISYSTSIIDELDQKDILDEFGFTKYNDTRAYKNQRISAADVTKLASLMYQQEKGHPRNVWLSEPYFASEEARAKAIEIAQRYYAYKKEHVLIDFDDILLVAYSRMLKDDYKKLSYTNYSWIQVDEVQDLNPLQLAIIDKITAPGATVMYLGDEQQAIYSFMGAKLTGLEKLAERAGSGHVLRLYTNYRSPKYLVDVLNKYAANQLHLNPALLPKPDRKEESQRGFLNIFSYPTDAAMEYDIAGRVKSAVEKFPDERIGVLTRSNAAADVISNRLTEKGVPHFRLSGRDVFKTDEFKTILSHFSLIQNDASFLDWARVLWMTGATPSFKDARAAVTQLRDAAITPTDFLFREYGHTYLDDFLEIYRNRELVIFDTESTGLDVSSDDIIQIAAIKIRGGEIVPGSEFNVIIRTNKAIPEKLGNETNPMLEVYSNSEKLEPEEAFRQFLEYVGEDDVLGHNVGFDYQILKYNLLRRFNGTVLEDHIKTVWDSLKLIRLLEPRLRVYKLRALLEAFGLHGENSHRADDDIVATKSLVDFCAGRIDETSQRRQELLRNVNMRQISSNLKKKYAEIYETSTKLYSVNDKSSTVADNVVFLDEMRRVYNAFRSSGAMGEIQGFDYVVEFLRKAVFHEGEPNNLRAQITCHLQDVRSFSQADLCDSGVIKENVYVMTVHKAKGLEFEHVMVYDARNDLYPFYSNSNNPTAILEDARVFYVALSRAKKRITVMYSETMRGFQKDLTPFMSEVRTDFNLYSVKESFEK